MTGNSIILATSGEAAKSGVCNDNGRTKKSSAKGRGGGKGQGGWWERGTRGRKNERKRRPRLRVRRRSYDLLRLKDTFLVEMEHDASVCRSRRLIKRLTSNVTVNREYRTRSRIVGYYICRAPLEQSVFAAPALPPRSRRDNDKRNKIHSGKFARNYFERTGGARETNS